MARRTCEGDAVDANSRAIDHPPTRRGLRRRWWWALAETAAGAALLVPLVVWGVESSNLAPFAFIAGVPMFVFGVVGLVATALIRRALIRNPWVVTTGRYYFQMYRGAALECDTANGDRLVLRVYTCNLLRQRALSNLPGDQVWVAVGSAGVGAAAPVPGERLVLVTLPPVDSLRQRYAEKSIVPERPTT